MLAHGECSLPRLTVGHSEGNAESLGDVYVAYGCSVADDGISCERNAGAFTRHEACSVASHQHLPHDLPLRDQIAHLAWRSRSQKLALVCPSVTAQQPVALTSDHVLEHLRWRAPDVIVLQMTRERHPFRVGQPGQSNTRLGDKLGKGCVRSDADPVSSVHDKL